ncbi:serine hydrolase domain-containing protein [Streptomyces sp. P1-3]|uniref:serine hydrolase domain-containing protein n=1 Tax=Streptomyces sp. P1-3 TaxID=3421658 RepID=UPI003D35F0A9
MVIRRGLAAAAVAATVMAVALTSPALAAPPGATHHERTQAAMDDIVKAGAVGVTAQAKGHGKYATWNAASGLGDLDKGTPRGDRDHYRVGSVTKTFIATVLLQLEAEGRIDMDDTIGRWLPGVVEGNGNDGDKITVRQVLNHTSGLFDLNTDPEFQEKVYSEGFLQHRYDTWSPEQMVRMAMRHSPAFEPGKGWNYSKTNYIVAGMIIEKVTGNPYADEIRDRVIRPLGLRGTSVPGTSTTVPAPSSRAYERLSGDPAGTRYDVTELNPSFAGAAGEMISDSADLNRFYSALLRGKLLPPKQLDEMRTTVPVHEQLPELRYGLGVMERELSCGVRVMGHTGGVHGSSTVAMATPDGRHSFAANVNGDMTWRTDTTPLLEAEFCGV